MESASVPNQLERPDKQRVAPCFTPCFTTHASLNKGWPRASRASRVAPCFVPFSEIANRTRLRRRCATNLVNPPASGVLAGHCRIEMRRSQAPANDDGGTGMESASVPNQLERPDKQRLAPCFFP
jgi:hypothetical protein